MLLTKLAFHHLKQCKFRTFLMIMSVFLSVTLVSGISIYNASTIENQYYMQEQASGSWFLNYAYEDEDSVKNILNKTEIEHVSLSKTLDVKKEREDYIINLTGYSDFELNPHCLIEGRYPENNNEVLVSNDYLNETGHQIGDTIYFENTDKEYMITGTMQYMQYHSQEAKFDEVITKIDLIKEPGTKIYVKIEPISNELYQEIVPSTGSYNSIPSLYFNNEIILKTYLAQESKSSITDYVPAMIMIIILLLNLYFMIHTIFISVYEERKTYFGILMSVGADEKQVIKIALIEGMLILVISLPLALLCAYHIIDYIFIQSTKLVIQQTSMFAGKLFIYPLYLCLTLIISSAVVLLSSLQAILKVSKNYPIEIIKNTNEIKQDKIKALSNNKIETAYARHYIKQNKGKYGSLIISVCLSLIVFLCGSYFFHVRYQLMNPQEAKNLIEVQMNEINTIDENSELQLVLNQIKEQNSNQETIVYSSYSLYNVKMKESDYNTKYVHNYTGNTLTSVNMRFYGISDELFYKIPGVTSNQTEFIIHDYLPSENYEEGNIYTILKENESIQTFASNTLVVEDEWKKIDLEVAFSTANTIPHSEVPFIAYDAIQAGINPEIVIVYPYSKFQENLQTMLKQSEGSIQVNTQVQLRNEEYPSLVEELKQLKQETNYIRNIIPPKAADESMKYGNTNFKAMILFILAIALCNIASVVISNIFSKRKDYAMLQSIGCDEKQLLEITMKEMLSVIMIAIIISFIVSMGINFGMYQVFKQYHIEFFILWKDYLIIFSFMLLTAILSSMITYRKIMKDSIVETLRSIDS